MLAPTCHVMVNISPQSLPRVSQGAAQWPVHPLCRSFSPLSLLQVDAHLSYDSVASIDKALKVQCDCLFGVFISLRIPESDLERVYSCSKRPASVGAAPHHAPPPIISPRSSLTCTRQRASTPPGSTSRWPPPGRASRPAGSWRPRASTAT